MDAMYDQLCPRLQALWDETKAEKLKLEEKAAKAKAARAEKARAARAAKAGKT